MHEKVQCVECHVKPVFTNVGKNCADCHADIHRRQMGSNCEQCHTVQGWDIAVQQVKDHQNRFPLLGSHSAVQCQDCHKQAAVGIFYGLSTRCDSCHLKDWQKTTNPPHSANAVVFAPDKCEQCHVTFDSWLGAKFDHSTTGFPLTAGHANVPCANCHINNNYNLQIQPNDCGNSGCHLKDWQQTNNPPHPSAGTQFAAANCANCHNTTGWQNVTFDHSTTGFPLTLGHANVPCTSCHVNNNYNLQTQPNDCGNSGCHLKDWQNTNNPVHSTSGPAFAVSNCANCHSPKGWDSASFDHSTTGFALTGTHATTPCTQCHVNNNYSLSSADCMGCHQSSWNSTQTLGGNVPNHVASNFPNTASACASCHPITTWADGKFDHSTTGFPLQNSHQMAPAGKVSACTQCHVGGNYNLTIQPTDCGNAGCHLKDWQTTNNPVHSTSGPAFAAANCATCHTTVGWDSASFDHSTTGFALTGTHATTPCAQCHVNNNYSLSSADCMGCHQSSWNSTQTLGGNVPNHVTANFPTSASACSTCHPITAWADGKFDHTATGFPLQNSHQMAPAGKVTACTQCHVGGNYNLSIQPTDCGNSGCHLTTWQQTNNPTHSSAGSAFAAANCATCHDTITWTDNTFNHSVTGWPLTGAHTTTPCASCHTNNNYNFTSANTDCYGCHQDKYNSTATLGGTVPNHVSAGFPASQCTSCHTTTNWTSTWNHTATGFALTGTHATTPCAQCHVNNNYSLTSANTNCIGCHQTDWNSTQTLGGNVPNHVSANFPQTAAACASCHPITTWSAGVFDHSTTGFPLQNSHQMAPAGKVTACTQCHVGGNYNLSIQPTDCGNSGCHLTTWQQTNNPTHSSAGSAFAAANCATCHDTITWTDNTFNHSVTGWPLTGAHTTTPCASCHTNNNYNFTSANTDCYGCHQDKYNSTATLGGTVPNHVSAGFPTSQCSSCHTTTNWTSTWNHTSTGFALTGTHATTPCVQCHVNNNYSLTSANTNCIGCHQTDWNSTQTLGGNVPNHVSANFPQTAAACASCHPITTWSAGVFDHSTTGFPLQNSHQMAPAGKVTACTQCHVGGNYNLSIQPTDCGNSGCHLTTWQQTNNPTHSTAGSAFAAANCSTCHDTIAWTDSTFDHSATGWALTGSHQMAPAGKVTACTQCHVNNNYNFTSANTDCYGCHTTDWTSTQTLGGTVPNHVAAAFPTSLCSTCHDTLLWSDGKFDHSTTGWALTGAHQMPPAAGSKVAGCTDCHVNNNYSLTSANTACYGCHQAAWNSTQTLGGSVPNHIAAGYPTTCDTCHTTSSWLGATFSHTYFPIPHNGSVCNDCHQVSTDYSSFTCINCHTRTAHQQSQTNNEHGGVRGYTYTATSCYNCHKNGGG